MNDDITAEVSLTGVAPALRLTAAPPAGRVTHLKVFKPNNKSEPLICVSVCVCSPVLRCVCVEVDGVCDLLQLLHVFRSRHVLLKQLEINRAHL